MGTPIDSPGSSEERPTDPEPREAIPISSLPLLVTCPGWFLLVRAASPRSAPETGPAGDVAGRVRAALSNPEVDREALQKLVPPRKPPRR